MPTPPPFDFYADNPGAPIMPAPGPPAEAPPSLDARRHIAALPALPEADALRRHMEELRAEAGADPARLALQAIVLLADVAPDAYLTEPHFHAAVEYARRGLELGESGPSPSSPLEARIPPRASRAPTAVPPPGPPSTEDAR